MKPDERWDEREDLQDLLSAEREAPGPDRAARERVMARVAVSVAVGAAGLSAGAAQAATAGGAVAGGSAGAAAGSVGAAAVGSSAAAVGSGAAAALGAKLWIGVASAVLVGATTAVVYTKVRTEPARVERHAPPAHEPRAERLSERPPERPRLAEAPDPPSTSPSQSAPAALVSTSPPVEAASKLSAPRPRITRPTPRPAAPAAVVPEPLPAPASEPRRPSVDTALQSERGLLAAARQALAAGDATAALAGLEDHRGRFPAGRLVEEREALEIAALARAGRLADAAAQARAFLAAHPGSLFRDWVQKFAPMPNP